MLLVIQRLQLCFWAFWSLATNLMLLARKFLHEACQSFIWKLLFPVEIVPSRRRRVIKYMRVYTFSHAYCQLSSLSNFCLSPHIFCLHTQTVYIRRELLCVRANIYLVNAVVSYLSITPILTYLRCCALFIFVQTSSSHVYIPIYIYMCILVYSGAHVA